MATVISKKALHEFLLVKCKEQTMAITKMFRLSSNTPKINKLKAEVTIVVYVVRRKYSTSRVISKSLWMMMYLKLSKSGKTTTFLRMRDQARLFST